jgi:hypothetical protein
MLAAMIGGRRFVGLLGRRASKPLPSPAAIGQRPDQLRVPLYGAGASHALSTGFLLGSPALFTLCTIVLMSHCLLQIAPF